MTTHKPIHSKTEWLGIGRRVLEKERDGLNKVLELLDDSFVGAIDRLLQCRGRVAVTGIGKAGLIGQKIAATLSSTGTPAYVIHPAEALHGDLGMVCPDDIVLALSNSGESQELERLFPAFKKIGCPIILITGRTNSRCAKLSDIILNIGAQEEACPLGMAPSASTTAMLAMGDAIALTLSEIKGFDRQQYAQLHPGGALGRSLTRVEEVMRTGENCPTLQPRQTVAEFLQVILSVPLRSGAATIVDEKHQAIGFFTLGDLGRLVSKVHKPGEVKLTEVMTHNPKHAVVGQRVSEALELMRRYKIDELPVLDDQNHVAGLIDIQDLLAAGFSLFDTD